MNTRFFIKIALAGIGLFVTVFGGILVLAVDTPNVTINMATWLRLASNEPPTLLPAITVTDVSGGAISEANGITLILPSDMDILWDKTILQITMDAILVNAIYSKDMKKMTLPISKTFSAGESTVINGAKIRIYERGSSYKKFGVDVNGDSIIDAESGNGFELDATALGTDKLSPFPIEALTARVENAASIVLFWENPLEPDFAGTILTRTLTRGGVTQVAEERTLNELINSFTDDNLMAGDRLEYSIKVKDDSVNKSEAVSITAEIPQPAVIGTSTPPVTDSGTNTDSGTTTEPAAEEDQPESSAQASSLLDSIMQSDIDAALAKYSDIGTSTENLKEIVYCIKNGFLAGKKGVLVVNTRITYQKFASIAAKAFDVQRQKGKSYLTVFKKLKYIPAKIKSTNKMTRKNAFKALLAIKGLTPKTQTVLDYSALKGYATHGDIAVWIVRLQDLK